MKACCCPRPAVLKTAPNGLKPAPFTPLKRHALRRNHPSIPLAAVDWPGAPQRLRHALALTASAALLTFCAVAQTPTAVFTTRIGFRDEVVFVLDPAGQQIHFRSRSLLGLYDFGKNRSRMAAVSERLAQ